MSSSPALAAPPTLSSLSPAGVQHGSTRTLSVRGNLKTRPISVWCDRSDVAASPADDKNELTVTVPAESPPGLAWVRLYNAEGAADLYPLLIGLLPEMAETEPNNRPSAATVVATLPMTVDGCVHKADEVDLFAVSLEAGQKLVAAIESREPLGTPADMVLQIVSADGYVVEQNDDYAGFDPVVVYTADRSGTVYVRLFAFPAEPDSSIRFAGGEDYLYRLTLTTGPYCSHLLTSEGAAGDAAAIEPIGWNLPTERLDVVSWPGLHWNRPERRLSGLLEPQPAEPIELSAATSPDWSSPLLGQIRRPGHVNRYKLAAKKGVAVTLRVAAQSIGSLLDPVLQIVDGEGRLLKEDDDKSRNDRDAELEWKPAADGDYWVVVRDRFEHAGDDYLYRLTATPEAPGVELTVKADHFVLGRKQPLDIPVKINRDDGYDQPLTIRIDGLPEGVRCDAVTSETKGNSSKEVRLKLEAGECPEFNGPVRITARVGDATEPTAAATADTRVPDVRSELLWLTVERQPAP